MNANDIAAIIDRMITQKNSKTLDRMYKRGVISTVSGQYADVFIEGNDIATKGVISLGSYTPVVGDTVLVLSIGNTGSNHIILGPIYDTIQTPNSIASSATITPSSSSYFVTALATNATVNTPGTAPNGTRRILRITDNGTSRTLTWHSVYRAIGTSLPTATTAGKPMYIGIIYNKENAKWDVVSVNK